MTEKLTVAGVNFFFSPAKLTGRDAFKWARAVTTAVESGGAGTSVSGDRLLSTVNNITLDAPEFETQAASIGIRPANTGTQNSDAWDAYQISLTYPAGSAIRFGKGIYNFARTFLIRRQMFILGAGGFGQSGWNTPTQFLFPSGIHGIKTPGYNDFDSLSATPMRADWTMIKDIHVKASAKTTDAAIGIYSRSIIKIEGCLIEGFKSHGIYIFGNAAGSNVFTATTFNITAPDGSGIQTITFTGGGTFSTAAHNAGRYIRIYGTSPAANRGEFLITQRVSGTSIKILNGSGVVETGSSSVIIGDPANDCNKFRIYDTRVADVGGDGLRVEGTDANAASIVGFDAQSLDGWGVYDASLLGNSYFGCHTSTCKKGGYWALTDIGGGQGARNLFSGCYAESDESDSIIGGVSTSVGSLVTFRGPGTVMAAALGVTVFQSRLELDANDVTVANTFGEFATHNTPIVTGGAYTYPVVGEVLTGSLSGTQATVVGVRVISGRPYDRVVMYNNIVSFGAFNDAEQINGNIGARVRAYNNSYLGDTSDPYRIGPRNYGQVSLGSNSGTKSLLGVQGLDLSYNRGLNIISATHCHEFTWANLGDSASLLFTGNPSLIEHNGDPRSPGFGYPVMPNGMYIGPRKVTWNIGTADPASGNWFKGDRIYDVQPAAGGVEGIICTTSGTQGTYTEGLLANYTSGSALVTLKNGGGTETATAAIEVGARIAIVGYGVSGLAVFKMGNTVITVNPGSDPNNGGSAFVFDPAIATTTFVLDSITYTINSVSGSSNEIWTLNKIMPFQQLGERVQLSNGHRCKITVITKSKVEMSSNATATNTQQAISYSGATFKTFGAIAA